MTHVETLGVGDLASYDISMGRGFLPEPDPLTRLPSDFSAWEVLADDLPKLLLAGRAREAIETLRLLATVSLRDDASCRRAMLLLCYFGHAYVWGDSPPATRVPRSLAVPWHAVAARLGQPPVLSYASYALANWRRLDPEHPIDLENIAIQQNFLGGADEDWFIAVHVAIECRAGMIVGVVEPAILAASRRDPVALANELEKVSDAVESIVGLLRRMPEHCDPYIYYRRVRPYLHGWKDNPALPAGLIYEGVAEYDGQPQQLRGETGAQSGIVPLLDALLGVEHSDDPLRAYLLEMRDYMPPRHRAFLEAVQSAAQVRHCVVDSVSSAPRLREAYNACVKGIEKFRSTHLEFATNYIHRQAATGSDNPTDVGTGGTPFMAYLRKHRDETAAHLI